MNEHESPIQRLHASTMQKNLNDLSIFLEKNFSNEPPQLESILPELSKVRQLGDITKSTIQSLLGLGLSEEMCNKLEIAIRILIFESQQNNSIKTSESANDTKNSSQKSIQNEIQRLKAENEELKKKESAHEEEIESLRIELQQANGQNKNLSTMIDDQKEEKCQLQTKIMSLNDTIGELSEKCSFQETNEKRFSDEISQITTEKEDLAKQILELKQVITNKNEKISDLELNQKKLQITIQNEKSVSSKLQTELDIQGHTTEKGDKVFEMVNESQKLLNESTIDNLMLSSKAKSLEKYIDQLLELAEELENRLAVLEEDKITHLDQIDDLQGKVRQLQSENDQKSNSINNLENEIREIKENIAKYEQQTGFSINDIESVLKLKNSTKETAEITTKPEKVEELEKVISSLLKYIHKLITKQEQNLPLLDTSNSFVEDQKIRDNILSSIEDLKVTYSLSGNEEGIELLDTILSNSESINKVIDDLSSKEKFGEMAAVSVLCSANSNLRHLLDSTNKSINEIESLLPDEYQTEDKIESITKFINESNELNSLISDVMNECPFEFDEMEPSSFIVAINEFLLDINDKVCQPIHFEGRLSDMPLYIQDCIDKLCISVDSFRNSEKGSIMDDQNVTVTNNIDELKKELKKVEEERDRDRVEYDKELKKVYQQLESSQHAIEDDKLQQSLLEENLKTLKDKYDETFHKVKVLETQRDDLINLCNDRKNSFAARKKSIMENEKRNYELQLEREKAKHEIEKSKLMEVINKKSEKIKLLKKNSSDIQILYESELSKQTERFSDLYQNFLTLKDEFKKQSDEREKKYKEQMSQLEERVSKSLLSRDDDLSINSTVTFLENTPTKSIYVTPTKATPIANTPDSAISPRFKTPEVDRFVTQIGRVLSKYTNDGVPWTRSKILTTLPRLVARLEELEKNPDSPTNAKSSTNLSFVTPTKANPNGNGDETPKILRSAMKQQIDWQTWATDLIPILKLRPGISTVELRTTLRDLLLASNAKCKLVQSITSLREQKKIMKKFNNSILFPLRTKSNETIRFKSLILFARLCLITKKMTMKISIKQEQRNSPRIYARVSPRVNTTPSKISSNA